MFDRISEEVHEYLLKRDFLHLYLRHLRGNLDPDRGWGRYELDHLSHERTSIDWFRPGFHASCAGILKNAVDQRFHSMNATAEQLHLVLVFILQSLSKIFFDPLG